MAESIITIVFPVESEAYQAMTEIRNAPVRENVAISEAALVKKENGRVVCKDAFDTGIETRNDTLKGGLVGGLIGILGGPLGILMGGAWGALAGSVVDAADAADNESLIGKVSEQLVDGEVAVISLVQETQDRVVEDVVNRYTNVNLIRQDAAEVAAEVEHAIEVQKELEKEARQKMKMEKKEETRKKREEHRARIKEKFENLKKK